MALSLKCFLNLYSLLILSSNLQREIFLAYLYFNTLTGGYLIYNPIVLLHYSLEEMQCVRLNRRVKLNISFMRGQCAVLKIYIGLTFKSDTKVVVT